MTRLAAHAISAPAVGGAERMLVELANRTVSGGHGASERVAPSGSAAPLWREERDA